jgi:chitin deacetylase
MLVVKKITNSKRVSWSLYTQLRRWTIAGIVGFSAVFLLAIGIPILIKAHTFQFFGQIVQRVETSEKVVALTFDDGPLPDTTLQLLDILKRNNARATFFQTGEHISAYPRLTRAVVASGNEIGNHSFSHTSMVFMSPKNIAKEIELTDELLRINGYDKKTVFRPPYGDKLLFLPYYLSRHDRTTIMWNINPDDAPPESLSSDKILTTVLSRIQPGSIIVLHPEYKERVASLRAIEPIIQNLHRLGYTFVTVSELLQYQK